MTGNISFGIYDYCNKSTCWFIHSIFAKLFLSTSYYALGLHLLRLHSWNLSQHLTAACHRGCLHLQNLRLETWESALCFIFQTTNTCFCLFFHNIMRPCILIPATWLRSGCHPAKEDHLILLASLISLLPFIPACLHSSNHFTSTDVKISSSSLHQPHAPLCLTHTHR